MDKDKHLSQPLRGIIIPRPVNSVVWLGQPLNIPNYSKNTKSVVKKINVNVQEI